MLPSTIVITHTVLLTATLRSGDVAHLSPTKHAHVNPYSRYRSDPNAVPSDGGLRPLRGAQPFATSGDDSSARVRKNRLISPGC